MPGVRVAVAGPGAVGCRQVLRRLGLRGLVEVFDFGFAEDAASWVSIVCVARVLVKWVGDEKLTSRCCWKGTCTRLAG